MDRRSLLLNLLLFRVWCSPEDSIIGVNGQMTVTLTRIEPESTNPTEGDTVRLQCVISNFMSNYVTEWTRSTMEIARNGINLTSRYSVVTTYSSGTRTEILVISKVDKHDAAVFQCCAWFSEDGVTLMAQTCSNNTLTVLYFPADMYPKCCPEGPFTVQEGMTAIMNCTTETGNPPVLREFITSMNIYPLVYNNNGDIKMTILELTVGADENCFSIECKISSQSGPHDMERSCYIGPITVVSMLSPTREGTSFTSVTDPSCPTCTTTSNQTTMLATTASAPNLNINSSVTALNNDLSCCHLCPKDPYTTMAAKTFTDDTQISTVPLITGMSVSLILLVLSLIVNIFFMLKYRHPKSPNPKETNMQRADPYMELRPTNRNREYMEPRVSTSALHTYCQTIEMDIENPKHDYERPRSKMDKDYETVNMPHADTDQ